MEGPGYIRAAKSRGDRTLGLLHPKLYATSPLEQLAAVLLPERIAPEKLNRELWVWLLQYLAVRHRSTIGFPAGIENLKIRVLDKAEQPVKRRSKDEVRQAKIDKLQDERRGACSHAFDQVGHLRWALESAMKYVPALEAELLTLGAKPTPIEDAAKWRALVETDRVQLDAFLTMVEAAEAT
jgi:hypothetical protein